MPVWLICQKIIILSTATNDHALSCFLYFLSGQACPVQFSTCDLTAATGAFVAVQLLLFLFA